MKTRETWTLVDVVDTRQQVREDSGKWTAIPGTGEARECPRCGKSHEVWAHVQLERWTFVEDQGSSREIVSREIVGVSCAKRLGITSGLSKSNITDCRNGSMYRRALARAGMVL